MFPIAFTAYSCDLEKPYRGKTQCTTLKKLRSCYDGNNISLNIKQIIPDVLIVLL